MHGQFVCRVHGGSAPQNRAAAKARLLALVDPAISGLLEALKQRKGVCKGCGAWDERTKSKCTGCGRSDDMGIIVKAATAVLDRTGFGGKSTVELEQSPSDSTWVRYLTPEERTQLKELIANARERMTDDAEPPVETTARVIEESTER